MSKKLIFLCIFLFLLSGCGISSIDTQKQATEISTVKRTNIVDEIDENTAVITDSLVDVFRQPDVQSERVTQAIYNQPVTVLGTKDRWVNVRVVDGYTGWIKAKYVDRDCLSVNAKDYKDRIVVTAKTKRIYSTPKGVGTIKDIVMGTELYCIRKSEGWYEVALPEKTMGWVSDSGVIILPTNVHITKTTASDFVLTATKLKGAVYLWGGVSTWGVDCSGLTYICSRINGVDLPRDADQQFEIGQPVTLENIQQGDLVFFSSKEDLVGISHVGIYMGDGKFINASKSKGQVIISALEEDYFKRRLVGIRRVF